MTKRERTTVNIPDELKRKARAKAILEIEDGSLSEVIRRFLQAWVDGEIKLPPEPEQEDD